MGSWLPWRKLASNPPGLDWPALPWQSRGLYALLLGLADDSGVIRLGKLGLQSLAGALRASWPELEPHFDALVMTGWAEVQEGAVMLPHFVDSQRAATTTERVAQYRERARNAPVTPEKRTCNESLPKSNEPVTKSYPDKNRKEENRSEENRSDSGVPSEPSQPALPLQPQQAADTTKKPSEAQVRERIALVLFGEIVAARMSVIPGAEKLEPRPAALAGLKACLGQGYKPDEIRRVIDLKTREVRADPKQAKWFRPTWFSPGNVEGYLALRPQDVTSARPNNASGYQGRPAPQEPPKSASNPPGGIDFKALREKVEAQRTPEGDAKIKADLDRILGRTS